MCCLNGMYVFELFVYRYRVIEEDNYYNIISIFKISLLVLRLSFVEVFIFIVVVFLYIDRN